MRSIRLENVDPVSVWGINEENLLLLVTFFPRLTITVRGNTIKYYGEETDYPTFEEIIHQLQKIALKQSIISKADVLKIIKGETLSEKPESVTIVHTHQGINIKAQTKDQLRFVESFDRTDLLFALGVAGTGKTYTSIALAVRALKNKEVKRIILTRPAVEAGEKLGFLPGDFKEKLDPYLQPLYDALLDMLPAEKLKNHITDGIIQILPLAYMRGRTLSNACIILDEAQNATFSQLKMFLTRLGLHSKMIITGDLTQIDLPRKEESGLYKCVEYLKNDPEITIIQFSSSDILRHKLVSKIIQAFEKNDK